MIYRPCIVILIRPMVSNYITITELHQTIIIFMNSYIDYKKKKSFTKKTSCTFLVMNLSIKMALRLARVL